MPEKLCQKYVFFTCITIIIVFASIMNNLDEPNYLV